MDQPAKGCDDTGSVELCPHDSDSVAVAASAIMSDHAKVTFALPMVQVASNVTSVDPAAPALSAVDPPDSGSPLSVPLRL